MELPVLEGFDHYLSTPRLNSLHKFLSLRKSQTQWRIRCMIKINSLWNPLRIETQLNQL